jgi:hypothetical protein
MHSNIVRHDQKDDFHDQGAIGQKEKKRKISGSESER